MWLSSITSFVSLLGCINVQKHCLTVSKFLCFKMLLEVITVKELQASSSVKAPSLSVTAKLEAHTWPRGRSAKE